MIRRLRGLARAGGLAGVDGPVRIGRVANAAQCALLASVLAACGNSSDPAGGAFAPPPEPEPLCTPEPELLQQDPDRGTLQGSPLDALPPHITLLAPSGQRAAWSPDGTRLLYLDDTIGDAVEIDLATGAQRELTAPFPNAGFLRAQYLPGGDLLLCGPLERDPEIEEDGRFRGLMWVQRAPFDAAPVLLGEPCWEGIAVDRDSDEIAWNLSDIDFNAPDVFVQALTARSEIWAGRIAREGGVPVLADRRRVLQRWDVGVDAIIEAQDFRTLPGGGARELIFSAYFHRGGEVLGVNLVTGTITGYSRSPFYEEPEGIHPSGDTIFVERDRAVVLFPGELDVWRLTLDGSGDFERMTTFTHYCGYGATNPVVSPDGRRFAFQLERKGEGGPFGAGHGLLLFDLEAWDAAHPGGGEPDPFLLPPEIILPLP